MKKTGLFILAFITSISGIFAEDYYVSPTGSATWKQGQGLSLAYYGSSPDLGAHEFRDR